MSGIEDDWYSTEQVARRVGMSAAWVRQQIVAGRLRARRFTTGSRATYRVSASALREFLAEFGRDSDS